MGFFGGGNSASATTNNNVGTNSNADGNQGQVIYGEGNTVRITQTDQGALSAGVALAQSGLVVGGQAVSSAIAANLATTENAFNFGARSLDLAAYSLDSNAEVAKNALDAVSGSANSVIDSIAGFASKILVAGETATKDALSFSKQMSTEEGTQTAQLAIKVMGGGVVLALAVYLISKAKK